KPRTFVQTDAYTGPRYDNAAIEAALARYNLVGTPMEVDALCERAAEIVAGSNVLGWFQGRLEWGPRALGNRSIIAGPRFAATRDILNARIKKREKFRPFAPAILQ